jgi:putative membrane protein
MTEANGDDRPLGWQRLSPWSVVFIFVRNVTRFIRENLPVLAGAGAGVALIERIGLREVAIGAAGLLALVAVGSVLYYRRFRFRIEDDVLRVQKGLLERTELKVRADNIQHLALEQPLHLRVFGLVRFKVDTPGGQAAEAELPGIAMSEAQRLRRFLDTGGAPVAAAAPPRRQTTVYRATARNITLHGLASSYVFAAVAAAAPVLQIIERRLLEVLGDTALAARLAPLAERPLLAALLLVMSVFTIAAIVSVSVAWLRFYAFALDTHDGRFTQQSGLFSRQQQVLSVAKLQSVEWIQTALGRLLGCSHLICRQVGGAAPGRERVAETFVIPGLDASTARRLARGFCPGLDPELPFQRVHRRYRRVLFLRSMVLVAVALTTAAVLSGNPSWIYPLAAAPLALWPLAHLRWRAVGWNARPDYLQVRRGLLRRRITMFAAGKVHAAALSQSWFQRRRNLVTLTLTLASGPVSIPYIREEEADSLVNRVIHRVESAVLDAAAEV